jgi:zinc D-Ala-D-Ala dipeptidase
VCALTRDRAVRVKKAAALAFCLAAWLGTLPAPLAAADEMPAGFVYLRDVDPSIVQDMRYAGAQNFTGHPVEGYQTGECVLARPAAEALARVQASLKPKGLTLKVYDCYRPARAVAEFVAWSKRPDDPDIKAEYYPRLDKSALFRSGYIAERSGHSRGATVDLTLAPLGTELQKTGEPGTACTAPERLQDGSLDMGTSFDCFDMRAHTITPRLKPEQMQNRALLVQAMAAQGFANYDKEWWHFTLKPEPYPSTYFDFPILPRAASE